MQPVIRHSFVCFPRNAKPKASASFQFQECGDSGTLHVHGRLYVLKVSEQLQSVMTDNYR